MDNIEGSIGKIVHDLRTPAFLVNLSKCRRNCERMKGKCKELGIALRPHIKTHKTIEGALLQTGGERKGIVVSTREEADFYAKHGFSDIVLARPITPYYIKQCMDLHNMTSIHFFVNTLDGVMALIDSADINKPLSALIKISAGYERAGLHWKDSSELLECASLLASTPGVKFQGIYAHCGDSYSTNLDTVKNVRDQTVSRILEVRDFLNKAGIECLSAGIGSTPSCSIPFTNGMADITEIHPGNYLFYDCQQESYGSCNRNDIAVRVMTRVVSHHPNRNQLIVDLGFTGLTKQGFDLAVPGFGAIEGHPHLKLVAMTQELGKVETVDSSPVRFDQHPIDSLLYIYPYHACATAGMYRQYYVHDDDNIIKEVWRPTSGW